MEQVRGWYSKRASECYQHNQCRIGSTGFDTTKVSAKDPTSLCKNFLRKGVLYSQGLDPFTYQLLVI